MTDKISNILTQIRTNSDWDTISVVLLLMNTKYKHLSCFFAIMYMNVHSYSVQHLDNDNVVKNSTATKNGICLLLKSSIMSHGLKPENDGSFDTCTSLSCDAPINN